MTLSLKTRKKIREMVKKKSKRSVAGTLGISHSAVIRISNAGEEGDRPKKRNNKISETTINSFVEHLSAFQKAANLKYQISLTSAHLSWKTGKNRKPSLVTIRRRTKTILRHVRPVRTLTGYCLGCEMWRESSAFSRSYLLDLASCFRIESHKQYPVDAA